MLNQWAGAQLFTFKNFNHKDGLNYGTINCVEQSSDGMIWLGTDGGELVSFDGKTFREINLSIEANTHHFSNLVEKNGALYFSSRYKGFYRYDLSKGELFKFNTNSKQKGENIQIIPKEKHIFLVSQTGIRTLVKDSIIESEYKFPTPINKISQVIQCDSIDIILTDQGNYVIKEKKVLTLKEWITDSQSSVDIYKFGFAEGKMIFLYTENYQHSLILNLTNGCKISSKQEIDLPPIFNHEEFAISSDYSEEGDHYGVLTNTGRIFRLVDERFQPITHNYTEPLKYVSSIYSDYNGDFWITSRLKGIYKISQEAFTKIQLNPLYTNPNIRAVARSVYGDVIIGTGDGKTHIGNTFFNQDFKEYDFRLYSVNYVDDKVYFSTNKGLQEFNGGEFPSVESFALKGAPVEIAIAYGDYLLVNPINKGLVSLNKTTGEVQQTIIPGDTAGFFYSFQISKLTNSLYVGSNSGVFEVTEKKGVFKFKRLPLDEVGTYSGLSTKDKFGNMWFSLDNGLVCIYPNGKFITLTDKKVLRTNLIYTLNADRFGDLVVGTNKGLIFIEVDAEGKVIKHQQFDHNSGFEGYETNMRASFMDSSSGIIYLGTIEGLFATDPGLIYNFRKPIAPSIRNLTVNNDSIRTSFREFLFNVNNSKLPVYSYRYRVIGYENNWKTIIGKDLVKLEGLSDGTYIIEVMASFDGKNYSPVSTLNFTVDLPIWKSNWFTILALFLFFGFNLFLLNQNKSFKANRILDTKDVVISVKMAPTILLFGTIGALVVNILILLVDNSVRMSIGPSIAVTTGLAVLYLLSLSAKEKGHHKLNHQYLTVGMVLITLFVFFQLYITKLNPYYIIALLLTSFLAPYILNKIRHLIYYVLGILVLSIILTSVLNYTDYPKSYFLSASVILVCNLILVSYIRLDALEKLIFVSGIVNRGDYPAIAFDRKGIITYVSENISDFVDSNHSELLNKHISILNNYVPYEGNYKDIDVTQEFYEGHKYLVPMKNTHGDVNWIEWSFKNFSADVKVIHGQDVSDRLELENTYELLVQSAEDLIFRCDSFGHFTFLNEVSYRRLGYTKEELLGQQCDMIVRDDYRERVMEFHWGQISNNERTKYLEFPIVTKDGLEIWIGQYVSITFDPGSNVPNGYIAVARDITNRMEMDRLMIEQKESITSSISYAKKIQDRMLPHERQFKTNFRDYFVIYRPKDIVSGDFYWYQKVNGHHIIALGDCTGHGVPGSFLTLLGINILNSIVLDRGKTDPGTILNELNERLIDILTKEEEQELNDGMEIVICVFTDDSDQMEYATAGGRFLIYSVKNGFTMYKADNQHIGDHNNPDFKSYKTHQATFDVNDQLILFSDGFQDQFGGENDKKFFFRNLLELLESNMDKELAEQHDIYLKAFKDWRGIREQTDDVTMVSILK